MLRRVRGDSMRPALAPGALVLARRTRRIDVGDVVVVYHGGLEKIKRVSAMRLEALFVSGDNSAHSVDSRSIGWLPRQAVLAKVVWPRSIKR